MPQTEDQIVAAALELPPDARTKIAERLLESVDDASDVDEALIAELRRRVREFERGETTPIPADEFFKSLAERSST